MAPKFVVIAVAFLVSGSCETMSANPIRKVVTMLQAMQTKIEKEGEAEKGLFNKFMCYCKTGSADLKASIAAAETKAPAVATKIEEGEAKQVQLKADLTQHKADRAAAKKSMGDATALRKKQAAEFDHARQELETNIAALAKAIAALEKGTAGGFLQTDAARIVKTLIAVHTMLDADRAEVLAFLSGQSGYAPQSGEIVGILKQMKDEMEKDLAGLVADEKSSIASDNGMMAAKNKEVQALTASIETKSVRSGELAVQIVRMKDDLGDTEAALNEDKAFLADMDKNCATKAAEWDAICKTRTEELLAIAETIKVLNDDDALELFKKTLPGAGANFIQMTSSMATLRQRALKVIVDAQRSFKVNNLDFIALALHGKKMGFEKVIGMIDDMVTLLKKEQGDDDAKKEYCAKQFDSLDDKKKGLERSLSDAGNAIADTEDALATLAGEIEALQAGIAALDKSVAAATAQRKEEHADYQEVQASDTAAKEVLGFAKNRLNKFYNPKLYVAPAKRELSEQDAIVVNMGGKLEATAPPGGIAGTGISLLEISRHEVAPPPPPETAEAYQKKSQDGTGVIAMIDLLVKDLDKELAATGVAEKDAQAEYEQTMADAADKRASDAKALTNKEATRADAAADLQSHKENKASLSKELAGTQKVIFSLHGECDWLLQYFTARKEARNGEIDSLTRARAVLSGADYSLVQMKRSSRGQ